MMARLFKSESNCSVRPISPYGLQKLAAETYVRMYHALHGLAEGLRHTVGADR